MMERRKAGGNGAKIRPLEFGGGRLPLVVNASGWLAPTPKSKMMEKAKEIVLIDSTSKRRKIRISDDILIEVLKFVPLERLCEPLGLVDRRFRGRVLTQLDHRKPRTLPALHILEKWMPGGRVGNRLTIQQSHHYKQQQQHPTLPKLVGEKHHSFGMRELSIPCVPPPLSIHSIPRVSLSGFIGPEVLHFLKVSKRLFIAGGGGTELTLSAPHNFFAHHSLRFVNRLLASLAGCCSLVHLDFSTEPPSPGGASLGVSRLYNTPMPAAFFTHPTVLDCCHLRITVLPNVSKCCVNLPDLIPWLFHRHKCAWRGTDEASGRKSPPPLFARPAEDMSDTDSIASSDDGGLACAVDEALVVDDCYSSSSSSDEGANDGNGESGKYSHHHSQCRLLSAGVFSAKECHQFVDQVKKCFSAEGESDKADKGKGMMGKCTPFCTALELWSYAGAPAKPTIETLWNGRTGASLRLRQLPAHRQSSANGCEHRLIIERIVGGGGHGDQHGQKEEENAAVLLPEKKDERGEGASGEQSTSLMTMDHHGNDNNNNKKKNPPQPPPPVTEIRVGPVVKGDRPQRVPSNCSIF